MKSETVLSPSMLALQKITSYGPTFLLKHPPLNLTVVHLRSDVVKESTPYTSTMAAQGYILAQRIPSEMQPNTILVSPLLTENTEVSGPEQFQTLDVCGFFPSSKI